MDYMPFGTLFDYQQDLVKDLTWPMRFKFAKDMAEALFFMHSTSISFFCKYYLLFFGL